MHAYEIYSKLDRAGMTRLGLGGGSRLSNPDRVTRILDHNPDHGQRDQNTIL
jgi:hypothetical protein